MTDEASKEEKASIRRVLLTIAKLKKVKEDDLRRLGENGFVLAEKFGYIARDFMYPDEYDVTPKGQRLLNGEIPSKVPVEIKFFDPPAKPPAIDPGERTDNLTEERNESWRVPGLPDPLKELAEYLISSGPRKARDIEDSLGCQPADIAKPSRYPRFKEWMKKHLHHKAGLWSFSE